MYFCLINNSKLKRHKRQYVRKTLLNRTAPYHDAQMITHRIVPLEAVHTIRHPDYVPGGPVLYETIDKVVSEKIKQVTKLENKKVRVWKQPIHSQVVTSHPIISQPVDVVVNPVVPKLIPVEEQPIMVPDQVIHYEPIKVRPLESYEHLPIRGQYAEQFDPPAPTGHVVLDHDVPWPSHPKIPIHRRKLRKH